MVELLLALALLFKLLRCGAQPLPVDSLEVEHVQREPHLHVSHLARVARLGLLLDEAERQLAREVGHRALVDGVEEQAVEGAEELGEVDRSVRLGRGAVALRQLDHGLKHGPLEEAKLSAPAHQAVLPRAGLVLADELVEPELLSVTGPRRACHGTDRASTLGVALAKSAKTAGIRGSCTAPSVHSRLGSTSISTGAGAGSG